MRAFALPAAAKALAGGALLALACSAGFSPVLGDDIVLPDMISPAGSDWSGFYFGAQLGEHSVTASSAGIGALSGTGSIGGVFGGYNYQTDNFVFGVEGDIDASTFNKTVTCVNPSWQCNAYVNGMGSLRGTIGYAVSSVLVYGTAGLAVGSIGGSTDNGTNYPAQQVRLGWTVGAGIQTELKDNWFGRLEYRYADLGSADMTFDVLYPAVHVASQAVRVSVGYRF